MKRGMRVTLMAVLLLVGVPVMLALATYGVLYFTTWGIPNTWALKFYAPDAAGHAAEDSCIVPRDVVTEGAVAKLLPALDAAEGPADMGRYATTIAREFDCQGSAARLARNVRRLRIAVQVRRRFSPDQQGVILLNTAVYANGVDGIGSASEHFFGKPVELLDTAQGALLVGMISRPTDFSPELHPDRALERRNAVLDRMYQRGTLRQREWRRAKAEPLRLMLAE